MRVHPKETTMKRLYIILVCFFLALPVFASPRVASSTTDELLISIPASMCVEAIRIAPTPLRFYHRLGEMYLAGTSSASLAVLRTRRIDFVILDDHPWTQRYAVVANTPAVRNDLNFTSAGVQTIFAAEDFHIVKGSSESFELLRQRGFFCVEIEREEIPVDATRTVLPSLIPHRDNGIIDSVIALVSDTSLRNYIQAMQNFGTRYWNNANRDTVSRWVRAKYLQSGIADAKLDSFQYSGTWQANVVATMPGTVDATKEFIVGGHHDCTSSPTTNSPGADDNASGTAAALEMARVLKLVNYQPAYTMRFMGYAAEEAGLRGSASYAQRARQANRDIRAMLNYDMIGNRTQTQTDRDVYVVWYTGSEALSNLHSAIARAYTTITPVLTTSYRSGSDSYSFWQQNYKSVFLIERDFSPYYHSVNDLLQYLDMQYCRDIVRAGLATLLTLDQMPPSVTGLRLRDKGDGTCLVATWDSASVLDFSSYKVYVGRVLGLYDTSYTVTSRSKSITGLLQGQNYFVGVSIVDIAGREGFITELSGIPRSIPLPPAGLTAESLGVPVHLKWRKNLELDLLGYNIYRRTHPTLGFVRMNSQPIIDTTWIDPSAPGGTIYYATATDSVGNESAPSDTVLGVPLTGVDPFQQNAPYSFALYQNYPNPFNPSTQIKYEIGTRGAVELKVFDVLGREVATLLQEMKSPGVYVAVWDAYAEASGVYILRLRSDGRSASSRMILMK